MDKLQIKTEATGIIVTDLQLRKANNGANYCFFRLKTERGKIAEYTSVKTWNRQARGIAAACKSGDMIALNGTLVSEYVNNTITIIDQNGNDVPADMVVSSSGDIIIRLNPAAPEPLIIKNSNKVILCDSFDLFARD